MSTLKDLLAKLIEKVNACVKITTQNLTSTQKSQARANIGAMADTYSAPVTSVNGKAGVVVLTAAAVGAVPASQNITLIGVDANGIEHKYTIYGIEDENAPE